MLVQRVPRAARRGAAWLTSQPSGKAVTSHRIPKRERAFRVFQICCERAMSDSRPRENEKHFSADAAGGFQFQRRGVGQFEKAQALRDGRRGPAPKNLRADGEM